MKHYILLLCLSFIYQLNGQNIICLEIEENPNNSDPALQVFSKYVDVFGCGIYAEEGISDYKILHAAAIWAELLDNDEDGIVDDQQLIETLVENKAMMPLFQSDGNSAMNTFMDNYNGNGVSAVLWQSEIDPSRPGKWSYDASVEEILHTINHVGHVNLHPDAFGLSPNSSLLTEAMDQARGGQFMNVPSNYPTNSWYHYDDKTCDYECMAIEYLYWSIVSLMGILDDSYTCNGIANEWELCSSSLLQEKDTLVYNLITTPLYKLPQNPPDGNYCPTTYLKKKVTNQFTIFPNPTNSILTIKNELNTSQEISFFNTLGKRVYSCSIDALNNQIDITSLPNGVYYLDINKKTIKIIKNSP